MTELFEEYLSEDSEMTAVEFLLTILCALFAGIVIGMLISPRKNTCIGSNNGNNNVGAFSDEIWEEDEVIED